MPVERHPASFRDNRGFIFRTSNGLFRQINSDAKAAYDRLMDSGLYTELIKAGLLVAHTEVKDPKPQAGGYKVIKPELIAVISYPYEWSYSQLQDAALATLEIERLARTHGLTLRDASAYNIQFVGGQPQLIDTLSFAIQEPGAPWVAYRQYCQHFLAPLALMSLVDQDLSQLLRVYIDGVPLGLASKLLRGKARLNFGLATHIYLHARFQARHASNTAGAKATMSQVAIDGLLDGLKRTTQGLKPPAASTEWGEYYSFTNYSAAATDAKAKLVAKIFADLKAKRILDLGGNDGRYSRVAAGKDSFVISADIDPQAVEANYRHVREAGETHVLPLRLDLTNPSPALGWANAEREDFADRVESDVVLALALIHHLAISNNLPFGLIASYFAKLAPQLVIEFVPKADSQVERLLATREDIFPDYTPEGFEQAFSAVYQITKSYPVAGTKRIMYHMTRRTSHA